MHVKQRAENQSKNAKDKKSSHLSSHSRHDRRGYHPNSHTKQKPTEDVETMKISFSQDKLEHMKKLAHELSLKLAGKVGSKHESTQVKQEKDQTERVIAETNSKSENHVEDTEEEAKTSLSEENTTDDREIASKSSPPVLSTTDAKVENQENCMSKSASTIMSHKNILGDFTLSKDICDSDEDLEDMKHLAQELTKELSYKVQAAAAINDPKSKTECYSTSSSKTSPEKLDRPSTKNTDVYIAGACAEQADSISIINSNLVASCSQEKSSTTPFKERYFFKNVASFCLLSEKLASGFCRF